MAAASLRPRPSAPELEHRHWKSRLQSETEKLDGENKKTEVLTWHRALAVTVQSEKVFREQVSDGVTHSLCLSVPFENVIDKG